MELDIFDIPPRDVVLLLKAYDVTDDFVRRDSGDEGFDNIETSLLSVDGGDDDGTWVAACFSEARIDSPDHEGLGIDFFPVGE